MTALEAPQRTSIRVLGHPWELQHVHDAPDFPAITPLKTWGTLTLESCGLTPAQGRHMAAVHEAAHTMLLHAAGYQIEEVQIYPDDPQSPHPWQRPGDGHTTVGALRPGAYPTPGAVFSALLAGQAAAAMWLEREGLANDHSRLLTYSTATGDHERLLSADNAAFLYGDAQPPSNWRGLVFRVDALIAAARRDLTRQWPTVAAVARFVDERGAAHAGQLAELFAAQERLGRIGAR